MRVFLLLALFAIFLGVVYANHNLPSNNVDYEKTFGPPIIFFTPATDDDDNGPNDEDDDDSDNDDDDDNNNKKFRAATLSVYEAENVADSPAEALTVTRLEDFWDSSDACVSAVSFVLLSIAAVVALI